MPTGTSLRSFLDGRVSGALGGSTSFRPRGGVGDIVFQLIGAWPDGARASARIGPVGGPIPIVTGLVLWSTNQDIAPLVPGEAGMWGTAREGLVSGEGQE